MHDFFKPILQDMATLRGMKRTRAGRRVKQLERLEQKQKEERQRRNREKQKDFCREVELHRYVLMVIDALCDMLLCCISFPSLGANRTQCCCEMIMGKIHQICLRT